LHQNLSLLRPKILDYVDKVKAKYESLVYMKALTHITKMSPIFLLCNGCRADINEVCEMATIQMFSFV